MKYTMENTSSEESTIITQEFILTSAAIGAPSLHIHLNINTENSTFTGSAKLSQATNPPPSYTSVISGQYITLMTRGVPTPIYSGQGYCLNTPLYDNLAFSFDLGESKSGRFKYKTSVEAKWVSIEGTQVEVIKS